MWCGKKFLYSVSQRMLIFNFGLYVLFTRQQLSLQKKIFKILSVKKNFLKGSKHKNGKNRYKSIQIYTIFSKIHVSTPSKNFFVEKKFFLRSCENETSTCEHPFRHKIHNNFWVKSEFNGCLVFYNVTRVLFQLHKKIIKKSINLIQYVAQ